jgi:hypothetical protein
MACDLVTKYSYHEPNWQPAYEIHNAQRKVDHLASDANATVSLVQ